ncbi:MAG: OmpA family protein [Flavobacteriales bacterium]|nr:OmpA family protein [Flavobacteriales bacterium]
MMKQAHYTVFLTAALTLLAASCTMHHMEVADRSFERMAYQKATVHYERALRRSSDRNAMLKAAEAFGKQGRYENAAAMYARADEQQPLDGDHAAAYARVLNALGRKDEAATFLGRATGDRDLVDGSEFMKDTTLFQVQPVAIPGLSAAFSAIPWENGIVLVGEKEGQGGQRNPWNGASFLDLYTAKLNDGHGSDVRPLSGTVNGRFHEGPAVCSSDGRTLLFTRSDYYKFRLQKDDGSVSHLKLFRATKDDEGGWGDVSQFVHNHPDHSTGHPALSADGETLYFISDAPGGQGGTDIYLCERTGDRWSDPKPLGYGVNTDGNEMFPVVLGDTLYFASDGHPGLGGLDVFLVDLSDPKGVPENLGYPINTVRDDFSFVPLQGGGTGFLSSDRSGSDRIYTWTSVPPMLVLEGSFTDDELGEPMPDVGVRLLELTTGKAVEALTAEDGTYRFELAQGKDYRVLGSKDGMFTESRELSTKDQRYSRTYTEDFQLERIVVDKPIIVENIYYDYDRWDLRPSSCSELDKLVRLFNDNPNLSFELSSHTDSRASELYNLVLSEARAKSAVDYLIRKGVAPERISAKGYGESKLVNRCRDGMECSEEDHQRNRRTEFKVTRIDPSMARSGTD